MWSNAIVAGQAFAVARNGCALPDSLTRRGAPAATLS